MNGFDVTARLVDALESARIPYMLVGSLASNIFGIPRSTKDADVVVSAPVADVANVIRQLGPDYKLDLQLSFESVTGTKRQIVDVAAIPFRIELFHLSNDPHDQERFQRRRRVPDPALQREVDVATPEDTIITKLRWASGAGRLKDQDDVRMLIGVRGDRLDWNYIEGWADKHATRDILESIRKSIPPRQLPSTK